MKPSSRRVTASAATFGLVLVTLLLAGCARLSPVQSEVPYTPSDGVKLDLGPLAVRNLLIVSSGAGQPGVLSGALVNDGPTEVQVTFTPSGGSQASQPVPVPPGQLVQLGPGDGAVHIQFATMAAPPGALQPMTVATPAAGPSLIGVPVLEPTQEYTTITPTPEPTTPNESPSATPSQTPAG